MTYIDAKDWIIKNISIKTIVEWNENVKNKNIPKNIPNKPDRYYKNKGWINWGDFLNTGRIANQNKKNIFLSYQEASKFMVDNNIKSVIQFRNFNLPKNIPTSPDKYYSEWINWGTFFNTGKIQDNIKSKNYLLYNDAKLFINNNYCIKSQKDWNDYVKLNKIPNNIPNHPELYYKNKNRGWLGWKNFLNKN